MVNYVQNYVVFKRPCGDTTRIPSDKELIELREYLKTAEKSSDIEMDILEDGPNADDKPDRSAWRRKTGKVGTRMTVSIKSIQCDGCDNIKTESDSTYPCRSGIIDKALSFGRCM